MRRRLIFVAAMLFLSAAPGYADGLDKQIQAEMVESTKRDEDPAETAVMVSAMRSLAEGKVDTGVMNPDAVEPFGIAEFTDFLKSVQSMHFAGRHRLPSGGLRVHGHTLMDFETLKLQMKEGDYYVTLYRDDHGKIAFIEQTT